MIITDKASGHSNAAIKRQAKPLEDKKVLVIPVAVGNEASVPELEQTTPNNKNIIQKPRDLDPGKTGRDIMDLIEKGTKEGKA